MTMTPRLRKFALTAHVTSSVGWFGAVAGFLALAITGLAGRDAHRVQAAYLAMESVSWLVIVPLSLASLVTGLAQALGTPWGLFRHYWVVIKLVMTVLATAVLLLHLQPSKHLRARPRRTFVGFSTRACSSGYPADRDVDPENETLRVFFIQAARRWRSLVKPSVA